jgi:hypothetical protein
MRADMCACHVSSLRSFSFTDAGSTVPPFQPFHMNVFHVFSCYPLTWQSVLPELSPSLFLLLHANFLTHQ